MNAQKAVETGQAKLPNSTTRKQWKKKTPVEVVLDQINRLREGLTEREEELKQARRQLQKLEEVKKVLEGA